MCGGAARGWGEGVSVLSKGVFVVYERQRETKRVHSVTGRRDTETVVFY